MVLFQILTFLQLAFGLEHKETIQDRFNREGLFFHGIRDKNIGRIQGMADHWNDNGFYLSCMSFFEPKSKVSFLNTKYGILVDPFHQDTTIHLIADRDTGSDGNLEEKAIKDTSWKLAGKKDSEHWKTEVIQIKRWVNGKGEGDARDRLWWKAYNFIYAKTGVDLKRIGNQDEQSMFRVQKEIPEEPRRHKHQAIKNLWRNNKSLDPNNPMPWSEILVSAPIGAIKALIAVVDPGADWERIIAMTKPMQDLYNNLKVHNPDIQYLLFNDKENTFSTVGDAHRVPDKVTWDSLPYDITKDPGHPGPQNPQQDPGHPGPQNPQQDPGHPGPQNPQQESKSSVVANRFMEIIFTLCAFIFW